MSDLSIYELEDIVWDDFGLSGDHIVPHPSDRRSNEQLFQGENRKRPRREVNRVSSNVGDRYAAKCVGQETEERDSTSPTKRRNTMLEKDPWSHIPDCMFSASCESDPIKGVTSLTSDNMGIPSQCFKSSNIDPIGDGELCADDPILSDKCTAIDSNSYSYPLSHISQAQDDLSFLDNDRDEKESGDLLYYGWSDIENFEDVDRMFRSCDSSFGLGGAGNEDELGWFSSSDAIEGSEDALKSDFKFSCPKSNALKNGSQEASNVSNESSSINDSRTISALASYNASSRPSEIDEPTSLNHLSFANGSSQSSESKDKFMPKDQFSLHKNQSKHQSRREEKVQDHCLENGGSLPHKGSLKNKDMHLPSGDTAHQVFTSVGIRPQKQSVGPDSFSYLQTNTPYIHLDYCLPSDQTTVSPKLSGVKSENNGLTSLSAKESSYASNQVQSMDSSHDPSSNAIKLGDMREKVHAGQGFQPSLTSNPKHIGLAIQSPICNPVSVRKQVHQYGNGLKKQRQTEGVDLGILAELGSSNVQENSSMNSRLDEISLEASSFRQLQQVMKQLDLRTKLCIRDSLYRLARSAEQRHNNVNLNGGSEDDRDSSGTFIAEGTNKCAGFMDMETDTNPIDRSIAHLLFHRPPESSAPSLKSHTMIHGPVANQPLMAEKIVGHEESAAKTDRRDH